MKSQVQSVLIAGVAVIGAGAIATAPSVQPPASPASTIQLAAVSSPFVEPFDPVALGGDFAKEIVIPPSLGADFPTPPLPVTPALGSIGDVIVNVYNAVEPWVQWGFELAEYVVGWLPIVGIFAPQIMIFYDFGEAIVDSIVLNVAAFLDGDVTFIQGLVNVGNATGVAIGQLITNEVNWVLGFLPPPPPIFGALAAQEADVEQATAPAEETTKPATPRPLKQLRDGVATPVDAAASIPTRTVDVVTGAVTGTEEEPDAVTPADDIVANADSTPDPERNVTDLRRSPRSVADGVVQAQGEIRGGVTKAVEDLSQAARSGQRSALRQAVADAPATAADGVQTASDDVRTAVDAPKADSE